MVGEGLASALFPEFRAEREDSHACRLRASSTRSARRMRTGFGVQGGENKIKKYKPPPLEGERRAGSQRVAPPENAKSTPFGVPRISRNARRYPRPAPGKRACRSSGGVCELDSAANGGRAQFDCVRSTSKTKTPTRLGRGFRFGGATQNRTGDRGVADLCLTAWPWRRI